MSIYHHSRAICGCLLLLPPLLFYSVAAAAPLPISSLGELQKIGNDAGYPLNGDYVLTKDLDASESALWNDGAGFIPIGYNSNRAFTGQFDGQGHVIYGLHINLPEQNNVGLFGYVGVNGSVSSLSVENQHIIGRSAAGGVVGVNAGVINDCYATGTVESFDYAGGLVGWNTGIIHRSYAASEVMVVREGGGFIGTNWGYVYDCYATGSITGTTYVGGLIGRHYGRLYASYATGAPQGSTFVGGLVGSNEGMIDWSFWDTDSSGQYERTGGRGLPTEKMQQISTFQIAGWSGRGWVMEEGDYPHLQWEALTLPEIPPSGPPPFPGNGSAATPYQIGTAAHFALLSQYAAVLSAHIVITADLDLSDTILYPIGEGSGFRGVFDGGGHVLRHAKVIEPTRRYVGIFSALGEGGSIHHIDLEDYYMEGNDYVGGLAGNAEKAVISDCYGEGVVVGNTNVGGLIGYNNNGSVVYCNGYTSLTGSENVGGLIGGNYLGTISDCSAISTIDGNSYMGGLMGLNYMGSLSNSYAETEIIANANSSSVGGLIGYNGFGSVVTACYSAGEVMGEKNMGGLIGDNKDGTVNGCYSSCSVAAISYVGGLVGTNSLNSAINACYARGAVFGETHVGGLVGYHPGSILWSFWDRETSGQEDSYSGQGLSTAEMTSLDVFQNAGWGDWNWVMVEGEYPRLLWERPTWPLIADPVLPFSGQGTAADPFKIGTAQEFALLSQYAQSLTAHIRLRSDIDLLDLPLQSIGEGSGFQGVFDGAGYVLHNPGILMPTRKNVGLFSVLGQGGIIQNLKVQSIRVVGRENVGSLAGENREGTIRNCQVLGSVSGVSTVGGLTGQNDKGVVENSRMIGLITGDSYVGGLIGFNKQGSLERCYAQGIIVGGLYSSCIGGGIGYNSGLAQDCYSGAKVSGYYYVGGFAGYNFYDGSIARCYAWGTLKGNGAVGGLVGDNVAGSVSASFWDVERSGIESGNAGEGHSTASMTWPYYDGFLYADWNFATIWAHDNVEPLNQGYPYLRNVLPTDDYLALEGDVAPRPDGDGKYKVTDWLQLGRFVVGLDIPESESEFQRCDCAPRETGGDGRLTTADWIQAARYAAGLDMPKEAWGPITQQ
ncbi:MAG: hypothetical protein GX117_03985 [Candidatus Hydrogenedentes bacterium]|nr:hypothetical protein [Candidatus Hydrogenedentota bacterium]